MIRWLLRVSFAALLILAPTKGFALKDATGIPVLEPKTPPQRIVTLAPSLGELAASFLSPNLETIIGVSDFTDHPAELKNRTSVGSYAKFNLERVLSLKPDLVLATTDGNPSEQVIRLRQMGLNVVVVRTSALKEIRESFQVVARALGRGARGRELVQRFDQELEAFKKQRVSHAQKVVVQVGEDPLVVAGKTSFLSEVVSLLGFRNLYDDLSKRYPRPSREDVLARRPDLILILPLTEKSATEMKSRWKGFNVRMLRSDQILRPSARIIDGLRELREVLTKGV